MGERYHTAVTEIVRPDGSPRETLTADCQLRIFTSCKSVLRVVLLPSRRLIAGTCPASSGLQREEEAKPHSLVFRVQVGGCGYVPVVSILRSSVAPVTDLRTCSYFDLALSASSVALSDIELRVCRPEAGANSIPAPKPSPMPHMKLKIPAPTPPSRPRYST